MEFEKYEIESSSSLLRFQFYSKHEKPNKALSNRDY